jgi:hypothetical protein
VAVADFNDDGRPDLAVANRGSSTVSVLLGKRNAATHFQITAPVTVTQGVPFTITVTALTAGNQLDDLYTGTVTFGSSDLFAVRPVNYTFTKADAGSHTFTVILETPGSQTLSATDTVKSTITGTASVTVNPAGSAPPPAGGRSGRSATDSGGTAEASWAASVAAVLAEDGWLGSDQGTHLLGTAAPPNYRATLPATDMVIGRSAGSLSVRVAASGPLAGGRPGDDSLSAPRWSVADLEAWFAASFWESPI